MPKSFVEEEKRQNVREHKYKTKQNRAFSRNHVVLICLIYTIKIFTLAY